MNVQLSDSGLWRTLSTGGWIRVLIVDDSPSDRLLYRSHLEADQDRHYEIREASNADEAMKLLAEQQFECILLDYRLPGISGLNFLQVLQSSPDTSSIPVIVATGAGDENVAVQCLRKGAVDYLPKEKISENALLRAIGNAIVQAEMKRTIEEKSRRLAEANSKLRTRNEEIERFYHTVSHEIKTPLTATREFIAIVLDGIVGKISEKQKEMLSHALTGCDDIAKQFNDLVDCTRLETGKLNLTLEPCSVKDVIKRSIVAASPAIKDKQIKIQHKVESGLPKPELDAGRITQVISNLLNNAVKFTEPGGTVRVFARRSKTVADTIEIGVRDTGCGIAPEHLPRIFDRLYQVTGKGNELWGEGLGLGLAIAQEIVHLHNGELVASSELGVGSCFTVRLPLSVPHQDCMTEVKTA